MKNEKNEGWTQEWFENWKKSLREDELFTLPEILKKLEEIFKEHEDVITKTITCLRDDTKDFKEWKWVMAGTGFRYKEEPK